MRNARIIARREFGAFFNSPMAYVVLGVYLIASVALFVFVMGGGLFVRGTNSLRPFFGIAPWLLMIVAPAVAMRLVSEERKSGTFEVLMTLPVREGEVVLGKFLGAMAMIFVGLLFTLPLPLTLSGITAEGFSFEWGPVFGGYLGMLFLASAFVAVSLFASALTRNQIVSFMLGLALCFLLMMVDNVAYFLPDPVGATLSYFSVTQHFESIARGVLDSRDLVFYASLSALALLATAAFVRAARS